jgi:hypothetical protein
MKKAMVRTYTSRMRNASTAEEKIDALSHAIEQLAELVDDVLAEVRRVERRVK